MRSKREGCGRAPAATTLLLVLALLLAACGGGGGGGDGDAGTAEDDPLEEVTTPGERPVQVTGAGKVRLGGTLYTPRSVGDSPGAKPLGVLFVPTIGAGNRNGLVPLGSNAVDPLASDLAKAFGDLGVVSYRYDGRGTGESKLEPGTRLALDDLVADAKAGVDLLAQRKETAGSDLAVVAYDQGGLVALRLAAVDPRVKRVVLISSPGRPLVEYQAAVLGNQFGPESGDALRAAVGQLKATRTLPPLSELRTELRPLLPAEEVPFLAELYAFDPAAEAARVKVPVLVVAPSAPVMVEALAPERLVQAVQGSELALVDRINPTLLLTGPPPADDPADPNNASHIHGAAPAQAQVERDPGAVGRIGTWLAAARRAP